MRKALPRLVPVLLLSVVGCATAMGTPSSSPKPNVLLIISDDLRTDLRCYGDPTALTPNIDQLAREGVVFERAFCSQALCAPSRAALLTGARPDTTQVWDVWTHFRKAMPEAVTLPQLLQQHGWSAQAIGKVYHSGLNDPPSWSVPHVMPVDPLYGSPETLALLAEKRRKAEAAGLTGVPLARAIRSGPPAEAPEVADTALVDGQIADLAVMALRKLKDQPQPFFLAVGFTKPHLPFAAPKKYWDLYDRTKITLSPYPDLPTGTPGFVVGDSGELYGYDAVPKSVAMSDDYRRWLRHGYLAATSYMDAQAGRVLDELARLDLVQDTIVIFWGDHGWKLGDYGAWTKTTNVRLDTHVPLIIRAPGVAPVGDRAGGIVEVVDIYPTLLELLGFTGPGHLEGTSFLPLLRHPTGHWKQVAFTQSPQLAGDRAVMGYSIVTETHRLTRWVDRKDHSQEIAVELYDHTTDPGETHNVVFDPANAKLVAELKGQLDAGWRQTIPAH